MAEQRRVRRVDRSPGLPNTPRSPSRPRTPALPGSVFSATATPTPAPAGLAAVRSPAPVGAATLATATRAAPTLYSAAELDGSSPSAPRPQFSRPVTTIRKPRPPAASAPGPRRAPGSSPTAGAASTWRAPASTRVLSAAEGDMQGVASAGEGYYKRGRGMPVAVGTAPDPTTAPTLTSSNGVRRGGGGALLDGPQYGRVRGSSSGASSVGSSGRRGSGAVGATPPLAPTTVTVDFSVPPDLLWGGAAALGAGPVQPSGAASSAEQGGQGGGLPAGGGPGGSSPVSVDVVDMRGLHSPTMRRIRMQARGNGTPGAPPPRAIEACTCDWLRTCVGAVRACGKA